MKMFSQQDVCCCVLKKDSKIYRYQHVNGRRTGTSHVRLPDMARNGGQPALTVHTSESAYYYHLFFSKKHRTTV